MQKHAYRLLSDSPAKKKAKKLADIVGLMGFDLKLSNAQEIVARLMGYDDWTELVRLTKTAPERGIPDQMLPPRVATVRQEHQRTLLADEFDVDDIGALGLLEALAPTGEVRAGHWPTIEKLGLPLADEDTTWLQGAMDLVRAFDAAVRPLFALAPTTTDASQQMDLVRVRVERTVSGTRCRRVMRNTKPADIVEWVARGFPNDAPLSGERLAEVSARADEACRLFADLDERIRGLGDAPMLARVDWTFLMLFRCSVHNGDRSYYTAISAEPWLHIGFDLPDFCFNPENEWNASRALSLQLALRREFLNAGWTGEGQEWRVTFRDGNSAKEEMVVRASSAGSAYAWVAVARAALRLAKHQNIGVISLISAYGPDGPADPEQALAVAKHEPIIRRRKLLEPDRLRVRSRRKAL